MPYHLIHQKLFDYYYNDSEEWKTLQYENDIENFSIQVFHGEPDISLLPAVSDIIDRDATRSGTRIPGISIENIVKLPYLSYLNLVSSKVTDQCIDSLAKMKNLKEVYFWNSEVTENGVKRLRTALPDSKILF